MGLGILQSAPVNLAVIVVCSQFIACAEIKLTKREPFLIYKPESLVIHRREIAWWYSIIVWYQKYDTVEFFIELENSVVQSGDLGAGVSSHIKGFSERIGSYVHLRHFDFVDFFAVDIQLAITAKLPGFYEIKFQLGFSFGYFAAPGDSILKVSFPDSGRLKF